MPLVASLIVRSRKVSKPRDWEFKSSDCFEIFTFAADDKTSSRMLVAITWTGKIPVFSYIYHMNRGVFAATAYHTD